MNKDRIIIILVFVLIGLLGVGIFCFAYRPVFSGPISAKHADWEAFGDFFWGLGTMLFTGLSVIVLYIVNTSLNKYNENLQKKQQEFELRLAKERQEFEIELEERRGEIQRRNMHLKRMDYWQTEYHEIVLKLVQGGVSTDEEWLNVLRRTTLLYKSMQAEHYLTQHPDGQELSKDMNSIISTIIIVLNNTYHATGLKTKKLTYLTQNISLNIWIVKLYFDLFKLRENIQDSDINHLVVGKAEKE